MHNYGLAAHPVAERDLSLSRRPQGRPNMEMRSAVLTFDSFLSVCVAEWRNLRAVKRPRVKSLSCPMIYLPCERDVVDEPTILYLIVCKAGACWIAERAQCRVYLQFQSSASANIEQFRGHRWFASPQIVLPVKFECNISIIHALHGIVSIKSLHYHHCGEIFYFNFTAILAKATLYKFYLLIIDVKLRIG